MTTNFTYEYRQALSEQADRWVPACGGHEVPFSVNGTSWLYVFNHATREHGWLNLDNDVVSLESPNA